jgi:hypothetical protein
MSAVILVCVEREIGGDAWLVIARSHGWLHGDFVGALTDARSLAAGWGVVVKSSAGVFAS